MDVRVIKTISRNAEITDWVKNTTYADNTEITAQQNICHF
jgi:hypothetical protein